MRDFPLVHDVPEVDTPAMIEVDRLMMEEYNISLLQMMENAGRGLAILAREIIFSGEAKNKRVVILAGGGGNGGGVLTAGRRLSAWGATVYVMLAQPEVAMAEVPRLQLEILKRLENVVVTDITSVPKTADIILDGLIGYSLAGNPKGLAADLIVWANAAPAPTLSLDVPSGFDATSGALRSPAISAFATATIALPKTSLLSDQFKDNVGNLYCLDISVPPCLYNKLDQRLCVEPFFSNSDIVRLR